MSKRNEGKGAPLGSIFIFFVFLFLLMVLAVLVALSISSNNTALPILLI